MSEDQPSPVPNFIGGESTSLESRELVKLNQANVAPFDKPLRSASRASMITLLFLAIGFACVGTFGIWYVWPTDVPAIIYIDRGGSISRKIIVRVAIPLKTPMIAPVEYIDIGRDAARIVNAKVPFVAGRNPAIAPYYFSGTQQDREKAATCLASAAYYEAGDDPIGMAAVVQVVLNRVRHPAFPPTVCGTVFQGTERKGGCQFSYTCDGALARAPRPQVWARARAAADLGLSGFVFSQVGTATHYHTDWVVPKWGPELDKLTVVHTHLFFRFAGIWGRPSAFHQRYFGNEVIDPRIANLSRSLSAADALDAPTAAAAMSRNDRGATVAADQRPMSVAGINLGANVVRLTDPAIGLFIVQLDPSSFPGAYAVMAYKLCKDIARCRVAGWRSPGDVPQHLPLTGLWRATLSFLYEKGGPGGQKALWNCNQMPHSNADQCLVIAAPAPTTDKE